MKKRRIFLILGIVWLLFFASCVFLAVLERQEIKTQVLPSDYWTSKDAFYVLKQSSRSRVHYYAVNRIRELGVNNDPSDFVPLVHNHHSYKIRLRLVEIIAISNFRELYKELVVSLADEDELVVATAIWANGYVRNTEAAPKVLDCLVKGERTYSLPTLARIGKKEQLSTLERILNYEKDEEVRNKIRLTISSIKLGKEKLEFPVRPTGR